MKDLGQPRFWRGAGTDDSPVHVRAGLAPPVQRYLLLLFMTITKTRPGVAAPRHLVEMYRFLIQGARK
ncbi:MAG: hypothetical protein V4517_24310 [Pseudomonadota bacterium]